MRKIICSVFLLACFATTFVQPAAVQAQEMTDAERTAIEQVVRDYILSHPEIIPEAIEIWQRDQQALRDQEVMKALVANKSRMEADGFSLVLGNPEGDVTIVEFFDYRCPYCVRAHKDTDRLLSEDPGVRLVLKQYPIKDEPGKAPASSTAARVMTAATKMNPLLASVLHNKLYEFGGSFEIEDVMNAAASVGFDMAELQAELVKPWIIENLRDNFALARELEVTGTPAFFVGDQILRGAMGYEAMKDAVAQSRSKSAD